MKQFRIMFALMKNEKEPCEDYFKKNGIKYVTSDKIDVTGLGVPEFEDARAEYLYDIYYMGSAADEMKIMELVKGSKKLF